MSDILEPVIEVSGSVNVPYAHSYGKLIKEFFDGTKQRKILANRCPSCKGVIVPPRGYCGRCFVAMEEELIELPHTARVDSFTVVYLPFVGQPMDPPYAYATLVIDGSNSYFMHLIRECEFEEIRCDMKVEAVWNPEPKGDLYDIMYWRPVKE